MERQQLHIHHRMERQQLHIRCFRNRSLVPWHIRHRNQRCIRHRHRSG